jgi:hypothetical protein
MVGMILHSRVWPAQLIAFRRSVGVLLGAMALGAIAGRAAEFAWTEETGAVGLRHGDRWVWRYAYGPEQAKPCFHPLALPDGPALTWHRPEDHRWHRALWFSWKYINGVNYWEEDPITGAASGRTEVKETSVTTRSDFTARIEQQLIYRPASATPVLTERRVVEVTAPDDSGAWHLDWDLTFEAGVDVRLDRTPLPDEPGGQVYGGYAGLSVRFARGFTDVRALTPEGPVSFKDERFRGRAAGFEYSGTLDGQEVGIAILDHPQNLNAPSPWYAIYGPVMQFFTPAVICYGPHHLSAGEQLRLRYRVVVHPGRWDAEQLGEAVRGFQQ